MKFIKSFFLTLLYTILLILILEIINWLMLQIIEKTVSPLFVWFYNLHWIWKLILIFFGGTLAITFFLSLLNYLAAVISTIIQFVFPYNKVMSIVSYLLVIVNICILETYLWKLLTLNFWVICLWLILAFFCIQINVVFILKKPNYE